MTLARSFWIPLACLVAVEVYASGFDGWGAWATAPLFLLPGILSLSIGLMGAAQCVAELRGGSLQRRSVAWTLVAAAPLFWLLVRRHIL